MKGLVWAGQVIVSGQSYIQSVGSTLCASYISISVHKCSNENFSHPILPASYGEIRT